MSVCGTIYNDSMMDVVHCEVVLVKKRLLFHRGNVVDDFVYGLMTIILEHVLSKFAYGLSNDVFGSF